MQCWGGCREGTPSICSVPNAHRRFGETSSLASVVSLSNFSSSVPFPCLLETLFLFSRPGLCSDVLPNQSKSCLFFLAMPSTSVLLRCPKTYLHAFYVQPTWTGTGSFRPLPNKAWLPKCPSRSSASSPATVLLSHHLPQGLHSSSFNSFLGRFSINRKQLPGWDSPLPPNRYIICLVCFIQANDNK